MPRRRWRSCAAVLVALALPACTAGGSDPAAASPSSAAEPADRSAPAPRLEDPGPVAEDDGYRDAVAALGQDEVATALGRTARVARLALADCGWWTDRTVDPELAALLTPEFLAAVREDVEKPAGRVRVLLDDLPEDDGNGHALAADLAGGCDDGGPLLHGPVDTTVHRDDRAAAPTLVVAGHYGTNVTLGASHVSANQDWVFTVVRTAQGWQVSDAVPSAHTTWAPPRG